MEHASWRWIVAFAAGWLWAGAALASEDGCLNCHQYRGLARIRDDGKTIAQFYVDGSYYKQSMGPHARLKCTDCHNAADVESFPHQKVSAVDCSKACHLLSGGRVDVRFSHDRVKETLGKSVHGGDALKQANRIIGARFAKSSPRACCATMSRLSSKAG